MKKKFKTHNSLIMLVIILTLTLIITRGFSYARYASNAVFNYYLSSKGFYFESENLSYDTKKNVDTMWDGGKVYFSLSNYANEALASETDITYEVSCIIDETDTNKKCSLNGTGNNTLKATLSASFGCEDPENPNADVSSYDETTCKNNGYNWVAKPASSELYFEISDDTEEVLNANVIITVTSTKPYKKELKASYNLIKDNSDIGGLSMKYEEGELKSNLIITNSYNENKCVLVSWDAADFVYDSNTSEVLGKNSDNEGNINEIYFVINKMDSVSLEFYEKDTAATYSELYFELVESNLCE